MVLDVRTVPCLQDNYAFVLINSETKEAAVVDVPEAAPINEVLEQEALRLKSVLITHHHDDHIAGLNDLKDIEQAEVIGAAADIKRLPPLSKAVAEDDTFQVLGETITVWDVSGHTIGHVAYILSGYAFTGDSLMALGCGRVFEGTYSQMWQSLSKFNTLPDETLICSGHEYTAANARFALTVEPENHALKARMDKIHMLRGQNIPTVPSLLKEERATNPFLRTHIATVKSQLGLSQASDEETFVEMRRRKDRF